MVEGHGIGERLGRFYGGDLEGCSLVLGLVERLGAGGLAGERERADLVGQPVRRERQGPLITWKCRCGARLLPKLLTNPLSSAAGTKPPGFGSLRSGCSHPIDASTPAPRGLGGARPVVDDELVLPDRSALTPPVYKSVRTGTYPTKEEAGALRRPHLCDQHPTLPGFRWVPDLLEPTYEQPLDEQAVVRTFPHHGVG